jgi:hypothetical protein
MARDLHGVADDRRVRVPGAYQWLLKRAQDQHDKPDPRTLYWDESVVSPERRKQLEAEALWREPSMRHAKLLAGEPVTVRWYAAIPPSRRRHAVASAPWLNGTDCPFVTVTKDDWLTPGHELDYLAPGPVQ